jgi:nucleoside-triphosphatase
MTWRERAETRLGVSGAPGVGKTTLVLKVVEAAKAKFTVCGFVTVEVRQGGSRIGFDVVDITPAGECLLHASEWDNHLWGDMS